VRLYIDSIYSRATVGTDYRLPTNYSTRATKSGETSVLFNELAILWNVMKCNEWENCASRA